MSTGIRKEPQTGAQILDVRKDKVLKNKFIDLSKILGNSPCNRLPMPV